MTKAERKRMIDEIIEMAKELEALRAAKAQKRARNDEIIDALVAYGIVSLTDEEKPTDSKPDKASKALEASMKEVTITELSARLNSLADVVSVTANHIYNLDSPEEFQHVVSALDCIRILTNQAAAMAQLLDDYADITDFRLVPSV